MAQKHLEKIAEAMREAGLEGQDRTGLMMIETSIWKSTLENEMDFEEALKYYIEYTKANIPLNEKTIKALLLQNCELWVYRGDILPEWIKSGLNMEGQYNILGTGSFEANIDPDKIIYYSGDKWWTIILFSDDTESDKYSVLLADKSLWASKIQNLIETQFNVRRA